jgi:hypothetical protein
MKLTGRKDIAASASFVFSTLADFDSWERYARRRGIDVNRTDALAQPGAGTGWLVRFTFRGRSREAKINVVYIGPGREMKIGGQSLNIEGDCKFEVIEMAPKRCRLEVTLDTRPRSLGARLFLQSLRLAKGRVDRRFNSRLEALAGELESRHRRSGE